MVKQILPAAFLSCTFACTAQDDAPFVGAGSLRGSAAISPGLMLHAPVTNNYVSAKLEYFTDDRISFRGDGFWFQGSQPDNGLLARNDQLAFGPFYHFGHDRLDAAIGFEPGLSFVRPAQAAGQEIADPLRAVPSVSLCGGITYSVWKYFHFFLDARYVHAGYPGGVNGTIPLDEVIISGGLGWQFHVKE